MSKTKKYYFYLNDEKEEQIAAINLLDKLEKGKRSETIKNIVLAGFSLRNIDERLPQLVASLFEKKTSLTTLSRLIGVLDTNYSECLTNKNRATEVVAWQKRVIDKLSPDQNWSAWISITESEYNKLLIENDELIQVRSLIGLVNGDQATSINLTFQESLKINKNPVIKNAGKLFGSEG